MNDLMHDEETDLALARLRNTLRIVVVAGGLAGLLLAGGVAYGVQRSATLSAEVLALRDEVAKADVGREQAIEGMVVDQRRVGSLYSLGDFVVNLVDAGNVRYANCRIEIEVENAELVLAIQDREALFRDAVVSVLGAHTYRELAGMEGKARLREQLLARFNRLLPKGQVARIYFTEFVIQ